MSHPTAASRDTPISNATPAVNHSPHHALSNSQPIVSHTHNSSADPTVLDSHGTKPTTPKPNVSTSFQPKKVISTNTTDPDPNQANYGVRRLLSNKESLASCDITDFVHDRSDESSWRTSSEPLVEIASHGESTGFEVPCLIIAAKDDLDSFPMAIQESTRVFILACSFALVCAYTVHNYWIRNF
ncbi:hypothetical protein ACSQ67_023717 [Phaseolus vulgaris]